MKRLGLIAALLLAGCSSKPSPAKFDASAKPPSVATKAVVLTEKEQIKLLNDETKRRHLRFEIYCTTKGLRNRPDFMFQAAAHESSDPEGSIYVEDGAKPWWAEQGTTQGDAAYRLYLTLVSNQPAPQIPDHAPGKDEDEKNCPPEIRGGERARDRSKE